MLKAVEDKIIVKPDENETTTASGFFITSSQDDIQDRGIVVSKGPGIMLNNGDFVVPDLEVGDRVLYSRFGGTTIEHEGESLVILAYRDILAILG